METFLLITAWVVSLLIMLTGLVSTPLPVVPGPLVVLIGAGVFWSFRGIDSGIGWVGFLVLFFLFALAVTVDMLSSAVGARWFGSSKWGMLGALIGGLCGLFFSIIGLVVGPIIGAIVFEMLFAKKKWAPAGKSGVGTLVGATAGIIAKVIIAGTMIVWFLLDVLLIDRF